MDKSYDSGLDRHFNLPHIRAVDGARPLHWLRLGWEDLRANPLASLSYGVLLAVAGYLILTYAAPRPYLITVAVSGFFLVGPLAAAGLYEISRRHDAGEDASFAGSLRGLADHREALFTFGAFLALVTIGWERISAVLFALIHPGDLPNISGFFREVFLSGNYLGFVATYLLVGGVLAALVFALSVVAIPMLMERDTDIATAMMSSLRAVSTNLPAMMLWAALIVVGIAFGFATMMVGMALVLPLLGHASWHAYRDMVER